MPIVLAMISVNTELDIQIVDGICIHPALNCIPVCAYIQHVDQSERAQVVHVRKGHVELLSAQPV